MPCYKPMDCWRQLGHLKAGEPRIVFTKHQREATPLTIPCGQCIGCRLERSRRWAVRLMHESQQHPKSSFLTLTYDQEHVPPDMSLRIDDFQKFMKRLRRGSSSPLRFFHCGEYGETTQRPHYHVCLFGEDFSSDREHIRDNSRGEPLYASRRLSETWGLGSYEQQIIGDLTFESAAYVARYCLKKITGSQADAHYGARTPEYVTMSRRPGIGAEWYSHFASEVFPSDSVVIKRADSYVEMLPPPFYDKLLEKADPVLFKKIKRERKRSAEKLADGHDSRSRRLMDREICKTQTIKILKRDV